MSSITGVTSSEISPRHAEPSSIGPSPPTENPNTSDAFNVVVSIPESIEIRMVDASTLGDYEVWVFIASLVSNFAVGFMVAYTQEAKANSAIATYVGWTTVAFVALLVIAVCVAISKRTAVRRKGKNIALKTSSAAEIK